MKKIFFILIAVIGISFPFFSHAATTMENPYQTTTSTQNFGFIQYLGDLTGIEFDRVRFYADAAASYYDLNTAILRINCSTGAVVDTPSGWNNINSGDIPGNNLYEMSFASTTGSGCYTLYTYGNSTIDSVTLSSGSGNDFTDLACSVTTHPADYRCGGSTEAYPMFIQLCNGTCEDPYIPPENTPFIEHTFPYDTATVSGADYYPHGTYRFNDIRDGIITYAVSTSSDIYTTSRYLKMIKTGVFSTGITTSTWAFVMPATFKNYFNLSAATTTMYAEAILYNGDGSINSSSTISFIVDITDTTPTEGQNLYGPYLEGGAWGVGNSDDLPESDYLFEYETCVGTGVFSATVLDDFFCGVRNIFRYVGNNILQPHAAVKNTFKTALQNFQSVPPFSFVYETKNVLEAAIENATTSAATVTIPIYGHGNFTILTPTTLEDIAGTTTTQAIFDTLENMIWLGTGIIIVATIIL